MNSEHSNETARRNYWREQMDAAYQWMTAIRDYPVEECAEPLVPLQDAVREATGEVRMLFSTTRLAGRFDRLFYLRKGLIGPFLAAARAMNGRGWLLKVEDAYRTPAMQKDLMRVPALFDTVLAKTTWECGGATVSPELLERRLAALIASMPKVGTHVSASALDISVYESDGRTEVDRGGPYLELSELTPMASPFVSDQARENRRIISDLMAHHGFVAYPFEFWHYSQGDAHDEYIRGTGKPGRYGAVDWDPHTRTISPRQNPRQPLNSLEEIRQEIARALNRAGKGG
jgi:zinc D-Ala-D-Ala dipeptidase